MIFDQQTILSDNQAITATAPSTNVIDLGPVAIARDIGKGTPTPIRVQVTEAFNTLTSLTIALQVCAVEGFGSGVETVWSKVVPLADLTLGKVINLDYIPRDADLRYMRMNYTVTGTNPTLGKITAGITMGNQSNGE